MVHIRQIIKCCVLSLLPFSLLSHAGEWTVSAPIHMPNLDVGDGMIDANVQDLAKLANAYMTFGLKYENDNQFYKYQGWHGGYADEKSEHFSEQIKVPGIPPREVDINGQVGAGFQLYQTIHAFEFGHKFYEKGGFRLYGTLGVRDYDMDITAYGLFNMNINGKDLAGPFTNGDGGKLAQHWTEATAGLYAEYDLTKNGSLDLSYSIGHKDSLRAEAAYRYDFGESGWFTRTGFRKDQFVADGITVDESGFLLEFGYTF